MGAGDRGSRLGDLGERGVMCTAVDPLYCTPESKHGNTGMQNKL